VPTLRPIVSSTIRSGFGHSADRGESNPNGYVNPVMEWDTNNPMDGLALGAKGIRRTWGHDIHRRVRHHRQRSGKPCGDVAGDREDRVPQPDRRQVVDLCENIDPGPMPIRRRKNRGGFERTNDVEFSMDGKTCTLRTTANST